MAAALLLSHILRHSRHISTVNASRLLLNPAASTLRSYYLIPSHHNSLAASHFLSSPSFSTVSSEDGKELDFLNGSSTAVGLTEIADGAVTGGVEEAALPIRTLISLLDYYHDLTGFPWWIIIVSSTVAMRATLLPLVVLQQKKMRKMSECYPKLPPLFPPPLSGRSYIDQFSLLRKKKQALDCPSYLWFFMPIFVQMPCFLLWLTSIRRMCTDHHPGFDSGGVLWFQNLTELPLSALSFIFPVLIAGLHNMNVQLAFQRASVQNMTGHLRLLADSYKFVLEFLTLPILLVSFCIPQGSQVFWFTNSSLSAIQQISLLHPAIRAKLGLQVKDPPKEAKNSDETDLPKSASPDPPSKLSLASVKDLSPKELVALSVQHLSEGHRETAIPLLQWALEKDPNCISAMILLGQTLLQKGWLPEATAILERAISKLILAGSPTEAENVDHLIVASQWAGVALLRQGKKAEGIVHLERIACLEEPADPKAKAHYFDGLLFLASALCNENRQAEAAKYLRLVVAYNPEHQEFLEQCENELNSLGK